MPLRLKIILYFLAAVLAVGGFFQFVWAPQMERDSDHIFTEFTERHIVSVADGLAPLLQFNRLTSIHETLRTLQADHPDWRAVVLYDESGKKLFPVGAYEPPVGRFVRIFEQPIRLHDEVLGRLSVAVDAEHSFSHMRGDHFRLAAVLGTGFVLIMIAAAVLIDVSVRRPTEKLVEAANRLAAGDFEAPLPIAQHDEIGDLITSFASMRDTIRGDRDALRRARDELETRVQERTAELQATNDALVENRARFSAIFENSPAAISLRDRDGRYQLINQRYSELLGLPMAKILGKTLEQILSPERAASAIAQDRNVLETGEIFHIEKELEDAAGGKRWFVIAKFPVLDPEGGPMGIGTLINDVTEQRGVEDQLRQSHKMEAVGHLTGGVAHEFNNLLTVVLGNLDLLQREVSGTAALDKMAVTAKTAALRGAELTQQLLAYSRKQQLEPRVIGLDDVIPVMAEMLKRTLGETIVIETDTDDALWPVKLDRSGFENALLNLCLNARDAMPRGGTIRIETRNLLLTALQHTADVDLAPGDYVAVSVSDDGEGIAPEHREQVFEPFFTTKEVGAGTGLGLSMVYGFVKQSGGAIDINSEEGVGTTVTLWLPSVDGPVVKPHDDTSPEKPRPGNGETILVVEDDANVRDFVVDYLSALGYRVLDRIDGSSALDILRSAEHVDVLFTDIVMPGAMDGLALFRHAREMRPELKVVFTTGYSDVVMAGNGAEDIDGPVLRKPYNLTDLAETLSFVIN